MHRAYEDHKQTAGSTECPLCASDVLSEFDHCLLIPNRFPYDAIAEKSAMLIPKRHVTSLDELSAEERENFETVRDTVEGFDAYIRNFTHHQTIPGHYHIHLVRFRVIEE